jgi:hypothetical protein
MAAHAHASLPPPRGFADPAAPSFAVAIVGDLHLPASPDEMGPFHEAREQLVRLATRDPSAAPRVVQLGDLGSYEPGWPGSAPCLARGRAFVDAFGLPSALVLGNHDLEGEEFATDQANLAAWHAAFGQHHYWKADLGPATLVGLSTTRFRSNEHSVHEVHVDAEQLAFLEDTLRESGARPVLLFTHAPILGSGLKVVQAVHVKNRCAWLNHSSNAARFGELVARHPNIRLWFSGHFHLSQSYPDSISLVGGTAFVLTGVIGGHSSRDGHRHSRLLRGGPCGFELFTVDHDTGEERLDLRGQWGDPGPPECLVPEEDLLCDPEAGWLCSQVDCALEAGGAAAAAAQRGTWFNAGPGAMLLHQGALVIEYDVASMSPVGAACLGVPDGASVRLVDAAGAMVDCVGTDGGAAVAVEVVDGSSGEVVQRVGRNPEGGFYQIFQINKWRARKAKEAAREAAARAAEGKQPVGAA